MENYIEQHIDAEPDYLQSLSRDANRRLLYTRMMSGHWQGRLLKMLTQMIRPQKVLEMGTFAGYSTLCIAEGLEGNAAIDTIEIDDELQPFLTRHFSGVPHGKRISLHIGDALEIVPKLAASVTSWDMVFIDADKRLYPLYYTMVKPLLKSGAWILADNTLWNGKILSGSPEERQSKQDPQLSGIMEFNRLVAADSSVEKVILPIRDGLTIIRVK